jgi:hypothetical protein
MDALRTRGMPSEPTARPQPPLSLKFRADALIGRTWRSDIPSLVVLLAGAAFVFRYPLFYGYRFIGNSDRWNHYLLFAQFHADALAAGSFSAWSENLLGGFDTLAQPFSFFSPLFLIPPLLHTSDVVSVFAYIAAAILTATLVITYWVIQQFTNDRLASITGASIYAFSTYSLLKLSQNDSTYLSILVAPILFYLVHTATHEHRPRTLSLIAAIAAFCFYSAFLQEFSYVVLFLLLYASWRALRGNRESLLGVLVGLTSGVVIALPRLLVEYRTLSDTLRISAGIPHDFGPATLLRFFSRDIFGRSYAESLSGPMLNLYEGDLLFATVFASLLLVAILIDRGRRAATPGSSFQRADSRFMVAYIVFVFATMHVEFVYRLVGLAYANISFQHSRIGVSALLPIALLSGLYVRRRESRRLGLGSWPTIAFALAIVAAATIFDYAAWRDPILGALGQPAQAFIDCQTCLGFLGVEQFLAVDAIRFTAIALLFLSTVMGQHLLPWFHADAVRVTLALGIAFQALWGANIWFGGPETRNYAIPYEGNNLVLAPPGEFTHPTAEEILQLKAELDNNAYRSITLCPSDVISVDCSNPMGLGWNLRLLDGYLSGVPRRLASLPWSPGNPTRSLSGDLTLHQIRFESTAAVPWRLMSLLNVRDALVVSPALYSNSGSMLPANLEIVHNPSAYVYPRAYFAQTVESVSQTEDINLIRSFFGACSGCDNLLPARKPVDEVEGPVMGAFDGSGEITVSGGGDRLELTFTPSPQQRFLVLNEMYASGWSAYANDQDLAVYPTNVFMRGVVVPPDVGRVTFVYHSFLAFAGWYSLGLVILTAAVLMVHRYGDRMRLLRRAPPHQADRGQAG